MNIDHLRNTADRNILSAVFLYILLLRCLCVSGLCFYIDDAISPSRLPSGKIIPGQSAGPPSPAPGRKNHPRRGCGIFPPLRLRRGLMTLPEATDPFGI